MKGYSRVLIKGSEIDDYTIDDSTKQNIDAGKVFAAAISRGTVRKNYTTNKITLGVDYIGNAMRLGPTAFPITPPIPFCEFPARNAKRPCKSVDPKQFGVWRSKL